MGQVLSYFITDDRHQVQTLVLGFDEDLEQARDRAQRDLTANPHHLEIEVRDGDVLLFRLGRDDLRPDGAPACPAAVPSAASAPLS
jgi:hypothetical protein